MTNKIVASVLKLALICGFCSTIMSACDNGWFGSSCQYKCHCTNNKCDDNGSCRSGSKCVGGWFGPACQYVNILATNGTSNETSLTDNDDTTCIDNDKIKKVTISFTNPTPFTWMRIHFQDPDQVPDFQLQFEHHDPGSSSGCKTIRNATVTNTSMDIHCDLDEAVVKVILQGEGVNSLCSVYISGGRNVALMQETVQSSSSDDSPTKAVDGDIKTYTHTNYSTDSNPTWNITFTDTKFVVSRYVIYNRYNCCRDRLTGFILQSFTEDDYIVFNYTDKEASPQFSYYVFPTGIKKAVSRVMIQATYNHKDYGPILSLGEVEIFGESACSNGKYGPECDQMCNCDQRHETCFVSTGGCPSGCASGFYGEDCQTDCEFGKFGKGCNETCSNNCKGDSSKELICDSINGTCLHGCKAGYLGQQCNELCQPTYYGIDCKEKCNTDCLNELCNSTTCACMECKPGKMGDSCQTDCEFGKFGKGCNETCSNNCKGDSSKERVCDSINGTCVYGCKAGYLGQQCNETCQRNKYGEGCVKNCSARCASCSNETGVLDCLSSCNHVTGHCSIGCTNNYAGDLCEQEVSGPKGDDEDNIPIIIGVVIACLVLVLLVVLGVILWRKRRKPKSSYQPDRQSNASNRTNTSYVNLDMKESNTNDNKSKDTVYYNMMKGLENTAIAVEDLNNFMMSHNRQFFEDQFYKIPANSDVAMTVGLSDENIYKNRFKNVCAFDHSRVHLKADASKNHGDYINASFIEGYKDGEKFIASQGPNHVMIDDFIRMLWEQKTEKVVMLTNLVEEGKQKCEKYWPEKHEVKFGEIKVKLSTTDEFADYTIRRLQLSKAGQPVHELTHFHYTSWPDKDAPTTPWSLIDFEQRVSLEPTDKPIVVHCSAGVGRTGTFIALCNVISEAQATGTVNFFSTLSKLRQERVMMIQTLSQYIFLHKAAQVAIFCMETTITTDDIKERMKTLESEDEKDGTKINQEFKAICRLCREIKEEEKEADTEEEANVYQNNPSNHLKNRFQDIVPLGWNRPFLMCDNSRMSDYINAVFVPTLTKRDKNLLTQLPLPTTISDFWRMVTQYQVSLIVAFEMDLKDKDTTIVDYLPPSESEPVSCPPFNIKTGPITLCDCWEKQKLSVSKHVEEENKLSLSQGEEHQLINLKCTTPELAPKSMLALMNEVRSNTPADGGRTVFVCRNGAEYSGLACVLSLLLDRIDYDQRVTIPLVVGTIKTIRPQVVPSLSQYKFLYQALQRYSQSRGKPSLKPKPPKETSSSNQKPHFKVSEQDQNHIYFNVVGENE